MRSEEIVGLLGKHPDLKMIRAIAAKTTYPFLDESMESFFRFITGKNKINLLTS